jgi:hypothetical protein
MHNLILIYIISVLYYVIARLYVVVLSYTVFVLFFPCYVILYFGTSNCTCKVAERISFKIETGEACLSGKRSTNCTPASIPPIIAITLEYI